VGDDRRHEPEGQRERDASQREEHRGLSGSVLRDPFPASTECTDCALEGRRA
jgi:hypothetical protein